MRVRVNKKKGRERRRLIIRNKKRKADLKDLHRIKRKKEESFKNELPFSTLRFNEIN